MTAVERIEMSRSRLRLAMCPPPPVAAHDGQAPTWTQRLKELPVVALVRESLDAWWSSHPMRAAGEVAAQASGAVIRPVARRHPIALVLAAGIVGALLVWSRPWRWALRPALWAGLAPQLASRVMAKLPIESWMATLGSALSKPPAGHVDGPHPAAGQPQAATMNQ